jgi:hypothetical protein
MRDELHIHTPCLHNVFRVWKELLYDKELSKSVDERYLYILCLSILSENFFELSAKSSFEVQVQLKNIPFNRKKLCCSRSTRFYSSFLLKKDRKQVVHTATLISMTNESFFVGSFAKISILNVLSQS